MYQPSYYLYIVGALINSPNTWNIAAVDLRAPTSAMGLLDQWLKTSSLKA